MRSAYGCLYMSLVCITSVLDQTLNDKLITICVVLTWEFECGCMCAVLGKFWQINSYSVRSHADNHTKMQICNLQIISRISTALTIRIIVNLFFPFLFQQGEDLQPRIAQFQNHNQ